MNSLLFISGLLEEKLLKKVSTLGLFLFPFILAFSQKQIAPAYPLLTHTPYFSIWSFSDQLNDSVTKHWTGADHSLIGIIKVDGVMYRFLGKTENQFTSSKNIKYLINKAIQDNVELTATQTCYNFTAGKIKLQVKFTSPLLLKDIEILSRPVSYISYSVTAVDEKPHQVEIYTGVSSDLTVNNTKQQVVAGHENLAELQFLKVGTSEQPVLQKKGDDVRIDWGNFYIGASGDKTTRQYISADIMEGIQYFVNEEKKTEPLTAKKLSLNTILDFGSVGSKFKEKVLVLGYDEIYTAEYFHQKLRPWWNKDGKSSMKQQMVKAFDEYSMVLRKCNTFDKELHDKALASGGEEYAKLCDIAYRQSIAAHTLTQSSQGEILFLSKENFSGGFVNTVDVTYPSAPLYLLYNPNLLKGMLNGIFYYSESGKWKKSFPAHDLGFYPLANGQTYPEDMPVEEAGNMIILTAAITKVENNTSYAQKHWKSLTTWVEYLTKEGLDPVNQLCTDDFAGHLARNANLSVKAIVAIGSYSMMAKMMGKNKIANKYEQIAKEMAGKWVNLADAGDHFSLTFDNKNSWSQKYNLVWDKVLGLKIFPQSIYQKEINYYLTKQNVFGLPLDSRKDYTKSDWILWTAVLDDSNDSFKRFVAPVYKFVTESPDRVPLGDWHDTKNGKTIYFRARSVVGGYYMKLLENNTQNK